MQKATGPKAREAGTDQLLISRYQFRDLSRLPKRLIHAFDARWLETKLPQLANDPCHQTLAMSQISYISEMTGKRPPGGLIVTLGLPEEKYCFEYGTIPFDPYLAGAANQSLTPMVDAAFQNKGNFFRSDAAEFEDISGHTEWQKRALAPFGWKHLAAAIYPVPLHTQKKLVMCYYFEKDRSANLPSCAELDFLSVPFSFAWMYRAKLIDEDTLKIWLQMLSGLTPAKLLLLREMVCCPRFHLQTISDQLSVSRRNIENHIRQLAQSADPKIPDTEDRKGNASNSIDLIKHYHFLSNIGRPVYQTTITRSPDMQE